MIGSCTCLEAQSESCITQNLWYCPRFGNGLYCQEHWSCFLTNVLRAVVLWRGGCKPGEQVTSKPQNDKFFALLHFPQAILRYVILLVQSNTGSSCSNVILSCWTVWHAYWLVWLLWFVLAELQDFMITPDQEIALTSPHVPSTTEIFLVWLHLKKNGLKIVFCICWTTFNFSAIYTSKAQIINSVTFNYRGAPLIRKFG